MLTPIQEEIVYWLRMKKHMNKRQVSKDDYKTLLELGLIQKRTMYTFKLTEKGKEAAKRVFLERPNIYAEILDKRIT